MLSSADARTTINYDGKPHSVINLCSYNYLGLANHPGCDRRGTRGFARIRHRRLRRAQCCPE